MKDDKMQMWKSVNLNDRVRVKLNDKGKDELFKFYSRGDPKYGGWLPEEKEGGYIEMQMWEILQIFGPGTSLGMETFCSGSEMFVKIKMDKLDEKLEKELDKIPEIKVDPALKMTESTYEEQLTVIIKNVDLNERRMPSERIKLLWKEMMELGLLIVDRAHMTELMEGVKRTRQMIEENAKAVNKLDEDFKKNLEK